jgi:hypothetical protein
VKEDRSGGFCVVAQRSMAAQAGKPAEELWSLGLGSAVIDVLG